MVTSSDTEGEQDNKKGQGLAQSLCVEERRRREVESEQADVATGAREEGREEHRK